jgi:uncharacterized protein (DUF1778 family)
MKRDRFITIRVSEREEKIIADGAREENLAVSTFVRRHMLQSAKKSQRVHVRARFVPTEAEIDAMDSDQISARTIAGLNLNQQYKG